MFFSFFISRNLHRLVDWLKAAGEKMSLIYLWRCPRANSVMVIGGGGRF